MDGGDVTMVIYWCRETFESILTGVYNAWMSRLGHENVKLKLESSGSLELFAEYRDAEESREKAEKVIRAVRSKISGLALEWIYNVSLSYDEERADKIYRFLIYGFHYGRKVTECLQIPAVHAVFHLNRHIAHETHLLTGFVRFSEMDGGILFSRIGPKNDVLPLLTPHFADRLRTERFIIYDEHRKKASAYDPKNGWMLFTVDSRQWQERLEAETDGTEYEELWKIFYQSIGIKERENYVCQRTHLAMRYRPYMTEFLQNYKE